MKYWHSSLCNIPDEPVHEDCIDDYDIGDKEPCCMCGIDGCIAEVIDKKSLEDSGDTP